MKIHYQTWSILSFEARDLLSKSIVKKWDIESIISGISEDIAVPIEAIKSKSRKKEYVEARHLICYVSAKKGISPTIIGMMINRDHATVYHAERVIRNQIETNKEKRKKYNELLKKYL